MKKISRLKKAAPLVLLGLLLDHSPVSPRAQALVGGPFDDNNFSGVSADGTYSGTVTGQNLIGIVSFGVSSSSETGGRFAIFHEGFVNYGAATGIADLASRRVAGSFLGIAGIVDVGGNNAGGAAGAGTLTTATQTLQVRSGVEGSFIAQMKGYPQRITFEGEGRLSSTANSVVVTLSSAAGADFTTTFNLPGSPATDQQAATTGSTNANGFAIPAVLRTETPFKIRGSRTSRTVFVPISSYTGTLPFSITTPTPATPVTTPTP